MSRLTPWLTGLAVLAAGGSSAWTSSQDPFRVGEPFPDLLLPAAADGRTASLADFRGQKLVLHVFASW